MKPEIPPSPTPEERTLAMLAHVLQTFSWFIGPLVLYLVKRDSRFVAFHAIQALIWQAAFFALSIISTAVWFVVIFSSVLTHPGPKPPGGSPPWFFIPFALIWLVMMGGWILGLILGIVYGIKANQGEWAGYPIIGRWARRLARVPPETSLQT